MQNLEITLFGDSIIDNGVYVGSNELSVLQHLQSKSSDFRLNSEQLMGTPQKMFWKVSYCPISLEIAF